MDNQGKRHDRNLRSHEEPKPGELIEISRVLYSHWALYVGDGYVIHLVSAGMLSGAGATSVLSAHKSKAVVKKELLKDVVGISPYRVNNDLDKEYKPLPVDKIISSAEKEVGKEMEYHLLNKNCNHVVANLRYGKPCSLQSHEEPKPGDRIEISRVLYSHWALYVGDGYVIHLVSAGMFSGDGSSSVFSTVSPRAVVKRQLLKDVALLCSYRVNNDLDKEYKRRPMRKIIRSAKRNVGKEIEYSLLRENCEHFVTRMRYGKPRSLQAENILMATDFSPSMDTFFGRIYPKAKSSDTLEEPQNPELEAAVKMASDSSSA